MTGVQTCALPICHREVYLPFGASWVEVFTGKKWEGGQVVDAYAPLDVIPVFTKEESVRKMFGNLAKDQDGEGNERA